MPYHQLLISETQQTIHVKIHRSKQANNISLALLQELHAVLDQYHSNPDYKVIVIEGEDGVFCTGMDFYEMVDWKFDPVKIQQWATLYMTLLRKFNTVSKMVVAMPDGKVIAGGTGLIAASDYVLSTKRTTFKLTESLWGLVPAMVAPYLIRRVGAHKTQMMALLAHTVTAEDALTYGLIDQCTDDIAIELQELERRLYRLDTATIQELKAYFKKLGIIAEATEKAAIDELVHLLKSKDVQSNIKKYVETHP